MEPIKFLKEKKIKLNGIKYKPYLIGSLPSLFAFKYDEDGDREGIESWFNYKGFTYVAEK